MKKLISGIILFAVILSGTAFAASSSMQINVEYGISVMVNGEALIPKDVNGKVVDPFLFDGTTYVPIRAISEALGATVGYDGETNSAVITGKKDQIDHAGEVKVCVEKIKIVNEYENLSYEFIMNFENLMILIAYTDPLLVADLKLLKSQIRTDFILLKSKASDLIKADSDMDFINKSAEKIVNRSELAIDYCIMFSERQNQETFNLLFNNVQSGMQDSFTLNTLVQAELLKIYNEIDEICTDESNDSVSTT